MNAYQTWMMNREDVAFGNYDLPDDVPLRVSLLELHPICRGMFALLQVRLLQAFEAGQCKNRFMMHTGYRSPYEQDRLYAQGRTKPGNKVTNAPSWTSAHQYGLAVDFVPHDPGRGWHWDDTADWKTLRELSHDRGLKNELSWDRPHVWHPDHDLLVRRVRQTA